MKIVGIADLHGAVGMLPSILKSERRIDVLLFMGDITDFGGTDEMRVIYDTTEPYVGRILGVAGNCDLPEVEAFLQSQGSSLHGQAVTVDDIGFVGAGKSLPCPGTTPNEMGEEQFALTLAQARSQLPLDAKVVMITHQPPLKTELDHAGFGARHVGSRAVRAFIERQHPMMGFFGHIHESAATDTLGTCRIVNPGPAKRGAYAYAEVTAGRVDVLEIRNAR